MNLLNSRLFAEIETEIASNKEAVFQHVISMNDYCFEIKRTLDALVEKYGGFINRYDDKIILRIDYSAGKHSQEPKAPNFETINTVLTRLSAIETKIGKILADQNRMFEEGTKNVNSYMSYFQTADNKKILKQLADEIINHN